MELSNDTKAVLGNFAGINSNIVVEPGKVIKTMSEARNVFAVATVKEEFPSKFGIYDLSEFLSACGLVSNPQLDFGTDCVTISDQSGRAKIRYFYSSPEILTSPSKDVMMPDPEVSFEISHETLQKVMKAANVLKMSEIIITANDGVIQICVQDVDDPTSNAYTIDVDGEFEHENFSFVMNISNLNMLPGTYKVSLSSKLIGQFDCVDQDVKYWIAMEKSSQYGN